MMVHIGQRIKNLVGKKNISISVLASKLEKTQTAVYNDFRMMDMNTAVLRKYSEILGVNMNYWFEDDINDAALFNEDQTEYSNKLLLEVKALKRDIKRLESHNKTLENFNESLMRQIDEFKEKT